jgi:hypothetical protein
MYAMMRMKAFMQKYLKGVNLLCILQKMIVMLEQMSSSAHGK